LPQALTPSSSVSPVAAINSTAQIPSNIPNPVGTSINPINTQNTQSPLNPIGTATIPNISPIPVSSPNPAANTPTTVSSEPGKTATNDKTDKIKKPLKKAIGKGFKVFFDSAINKIKNLSDSGVICNDATKCRTLNEVLYVGYCKMKALNSALGKKIQANDETYLIEGDANMNENGVTKFLMAMADDDQELKVNEFGSSPLYKICIPTIRTNQVYLDYHCPLEDCYPDLESSRKCVKDKNLPANLKFEILE